MAESLDFVIKAQDQASSVVTGFGTNIKAQADNVGKAQTNLDAYTASANDLVATLDKLNKLPQNANTDFLKAFASADANSADYSKSANKVVDSLSDQFAMLNATAREQAQFNAILQAGVPIGSEQADVIGRMAGALFDLKKKQQDAQNQTSLFDKVAGGLKGQMIALAAGAGGFGVALAGFGPWGLAAAAGLGVVSTIMDKMGRDIDEFTAKASKLRDFSDLVDLSATKIQALQITANANGVSTERLTMNIERLSQGMAMLRDGSGPLYDALNKVDHGLVDQLSRTTDLGTALNLLAQAYAKADSSFTKTQIAKAAGGNAKFGAVLQGIADAGSVEALTQAQQRNITISEEQGKALNDLQNKIDALKAHTKDTMASLFATDVKQRELEAAEVLDRMANRMKEMKENASGSWWVNFLAAIAKTGEGNQQDYIHSGGGPVPDQVAYNAALERRSELEKRASEIRGELKAKTDAQAAAEKAQQDAEAKQTPQYINQQWQNRISILGGAATTTELLAAKTAGLNAINAAASGEYSNLIGRAQAYYKFQLESADLQSKAAVGVATTADTAGMAQKEFNSLVATGKLNVSDYAVAMQVLTKKYDDLAKQSEVTRSRLPDLKKLEQDAGDLAKNIDTAAVTSLNSLSSSLIDVMNGSVSAGEGFRNFGLAVVKSLEQMLINMLIVMPIAKQLQNLLGGGFLGLFGDANPGTAANPLPGLDASDYAAKGKVFAYAKGGSFTNQIVDTPTLFKFAKGGSPALGAMGEAGPEAIMPLTRGPDGTLGVRASGGGGGGDFIYAPTFILNSDGTTQQSGDGKQTDAAAASLDNLMKQTITTWFLEQSRQGGLVNKTIKGVA